METAGPGLTDREARDVAAAAVKDLRPLVGPIQIKNFGAKPRGAAATTLKSPIVIFVADSRVSSIPEVYSNCTGDSHTRTIRCDLRMLDELIDGFALTRIAEDRARWRTELLCIVLAHELGHVVLKHGSAAYHGSADGFSVIKYANYRVELEADKFAVELLDRSAGGNDTYYVSIVDLATAALKKAICPDSFPDACPCPGYSSGCSRIPFGPGLLIREDEELPVTLTGTHPDFVVRFARMLFLSTNPHLRFIYSHEAKYLLEHIVVKDEDGTLESASALFQ